MTPMPTSGVAGPAWLVLPTYNEAENLEPMAEAALENLPPDAHLLVVDDGSPDGTGRIADRLAAAEERIEVLHRLKKEGLGPAYLAGFRHALDSGAGLVLQMDCDFSHDPADLPRLIAAAERSDVVIGSRYVGGGRVENWTPLRRAISRGGSAYARIVLGLPVRDLTGGFKCFRREVLDALPLRSVSSRGYAFQIELTYRAARAGFELTEIPICFHERRAGASKMGGGIVLEGVWKVPLLRWEEAVASRR